VGTVPGSHKLTGVLKGRTITSTQSQGDKLRIGFDDGSTMTVRTGGKVKSVRQEGTTLNLGFGEGSTLEIQTAEPTASVMVRDKNHQLEYAD
jgi:hypothetical protein